MRFNQHKGDLRQPPKGDIRHPHKQKWNQNGHVVKVVISVLLREQNSIVPTAENSGSFT